MQKNRIFTLVASIPLESRIYVELVQSTGRPAPVATANEVLMNRSAYAALDPAFAWHYAEAFALLRQPLPAIVHESFIKAAYQYRLNQSIYDEIMEAQMIQHPKWETKRGFLEALLLLSDLRLDEVAAHTGLSVSTVMAYEQLFWNVRDRFNDPLYLNHLCCPETRVAEFRDDYFTTAKPRTLMLRAAFQKDLDAVLQIFGTRTPVTAPSVEVSAKRLKSQVMADAAFVTRAGGSNAKLQILNTSMKIIAASDRQPAANTAPENDPMGLLALGMSPGQSILETMRRMCDDSLYNERLAKQSMDEVFKQHKQN